MGRRKGMKRSPLARSLQKLLAAFLLVTLLATACSSGGDQSDGELDPQGQNDGTDSTDGTDQDSDAGQAGSGGADTGGAEGSAAVTVRASSIPGGDSETEVIIELGEGDGTDAPANVDRETTLDGTPLEPTDSASLLDRLPDLEQDQTDQVEFNRPPETRPRPRPGTTVDRAFPPDAQAPLADTEDTGPLEVLRYQPEGPVDLAPFISVTFNQPMVALGVLDDVEAEPVPISITPEMPGRWIWLGTRTARFEYEPGAIDRIPAATNYVVEVADGIESRNGATLDGGLSFEFSTPAAQVQHVAPMHDSLSTTPVFFIRFDQRVDPDAVVEVTELLVDGQTVAIRLASDVEIEEDPTVSRLADTAVADRFIAIRPVDELRKGASVELRVGPNTPSAEGPALNPETHSEFGRTYGPLSLVEHECGWGDCRPGSPLRLRFTNPLEVEQFSAALIEVDPAIPGMRVSAEHDTIVIRGLTQGQTTYSVTVKAALADVFGQTLDRDADVSFNVGDAHPALFGLNRQIVTLDPIVGDDNLSITTINNPEVLVRVYEVDPRDDWQRYLDEHWQILNEETTPRWRVLSDEIISTGVERNEFGETAINLTDQLSGTGHVVVLVSPPRSGDQWQNRPVMVWVQRTTLGIDAYADNDEAVVRVTDLTSGQALAGIEVTLVGESSSINATTGPDGLTRLDLADQGRSLVASDGNQTALIGEFWASPHRSRDLVRWYTLDDRGLYKPGETVSVKGWVRLANAEVASDLGLPRTDASANWAAYDSFGNEIDTGAAELSPLGGFDFEVELPEDITLGHTRIDIWTDGFANAGSAQTAHFFQVQEFRRPDFEVTTDVTSDEPHFAGEALDVSATAEYFAGGPLAGSQVDWQVSGATSSYNPPNWPDFAFGIWTPWWFETSHFGEFDDFGGFPGGRDGVTEFWSSATDATGGHDLALTISTDGKPRPVTFTATATVFDVNRQPITGSASGLVHPADLYVGLRGGRAFVRAGESLSVDAIVTDLDGALMSDRAVTVTSTRLEWRFEAGSWVEVPVLEESCDVVSTDGTVTCTFTPSTGGRYQIAATVKDGAGRTNLTEITRWVAGGTRPQTRSVDHENLTLIPDAESWQPGETAEILVQSPFGDAHGLAVIQRTGIDRTITFDFDADGSAVLQVPITEADIPGVGLQIEAVGTAPRSAAGVANSSLVSRPAYASGQLTLSVPPDTRRLNIDVTPRDSRLEPGAGTQVDVAVTDPDGEPVPNAELVLIVVDEAVLSLSGYQLGDPLDAFYPESFGGIQAWRGRSTVVLSDPSVDVDADQAGEGGGDADAMEDEEGVDFAMADDGAMEMEMAEPSMARAGLAADKAQDTGDQPIGLRTDFDALAVFAPEVTTDASGRATVDVPLPDNLTRYRVMVVATADASNAGNGESNITARLPVTVRPTPPRFANFGDRFEFPVVVQNATDEDLDIDVALRATNLNVDGRDGTTVTVPANDRVEVRFEVSADQAGTARFQVAASAGSLADAAEGSFPVYTPATAEAFATYGVIDTGSLSQPFIRPTDVFPQFGGLEISTSSTAASALTDAVLYLTDYRFESSDAFSSRIMAIISLDDILAAFNGADVPAPDELRAVVDRDLERLAKLQNQDGGFPYWRRGRDSIPYNSVQAAHAMVLARGENLDVPEQVLSNALWYLAHIEDHIPGWYSEKSRVAIEAYALHVRFLAGDRDSSKATGVYNRSANDQLDVAAWLWPLLADTPLDAEIERRFENSVTETPNAATFTTNYQEQAYLLLHSDRRTDAIALDAFLRMRPDSDLVVKVLNGLLAARGQSGHWRNVQENGFVLLAGARYFDEVESASPDFVARAWLGDTYAAEHEYRGYTTDQNATLVPMSVFVGDDATERADKTDIVVSKDGSDGRLYYRLGLRYAPTDFDLEPRDQGFVLDRVYEAIDDPTDVVRNDDRSWTVRAGARVRVRLTMVADSRRTHVALIDPMPAGFEAINPALATTEPIPHADPSESPTRGWWWYRWFDHQNLRDDRAEAFSTWLGAGSYEYTYVARATTPGTFVVPPTRAEQMYEPEVFGRTSNTKVTITD